MTYPGRFRNIIVAGTQIIDSEKLAIPDLGLALRCLGIAFLNYPLLLLSIVYCPVWAKYPLSFLIAVRLFNCLAQITHGCGHATLFREEKLNKWIGTLTSFLMGYQPKGMWMTHSEHHSKLNTEEDGDRVWGSPDEKPRDFLKRLVSDLTGVEAIRRLLHYYSISAQVKEVSTFMTLLPVALCQGVLFYIFFLSGGLYAYFIFYVFPLVVLYPAQARFRSLVEHHPEGSAFTLEDVWVSRSTRSNFFEKLIFAPFHQNYHLEHHLFPKVPCYYLGKLNQAMCEKSDLPGLNKSYFFFARKFLLGGI